MSLQTQRFHDPFGGNLDVEKESQKEHVMEEVLLKEINMHILHFP